MSKVMIVVSLTLAVVAMMGPAWSDSRELNCWVSDPTGDATAGQPYQDIVTAGITSKSGVFTFTMNLAAAIPSNPPLPGGSSSALNWVWGMDTAPGFVSGYPLPQGWDQPTEFVIQVFFDKTGFHAQLVDRRPTSDGNANEKPIITPLAFSVQGSTIQTQVDASLMGNPSSFGWGSAADSWSGNFGSFSFTPVDHAPDIPPVACPLMP
jgi:hypothetical protein